MSDNQYRKRPDVKGPPKPWEAELEKKADEFIDFLKNSEARNDLKEFLFKTFKDFEAKRVAQLKARVENEQKSDEENSTGVHTPGNITSLLAESFNMAETENAVVRALKATKASMARTIEDRVEEIQHLLAGLGGFSSQLKSCFARSTVVFLEQEDPQRSYRERLVFSVNLPAYELKTPWQKGDDKKSSKDPGDGRTAMQATWDDAVNSLAQIVTSTGLKPKFVKNDRNFGRFVMKQDLRCEGNLPDEYFSFTLDFNTKEKINAMIGPYNRLVSRYNKKLNKLAAKLEGYPSDSKSFRFSYLKKKYIRLLQERDYFMGSTADPNQLEEGLLFVIEVTTLKDYHIVKDKMQSIMTRYILHLSNIATKEAALDPDLEYEMWKNKKSLGSEKEEALSSVPEYLADETSLKPIPKKKAA